MSQQHSTAVLWAMEKVLEKNITETSKRFRQLYCLKTTPKPTNPNYSKSGEAQAFQRNAKQLELPWGPDWWCSCPHGRAWLQSSVAVNWMLSGGSGHLAPCLALSSSSTPLADWEGNRPPGSCGGYRLCPAHRCLLRHPWSLNSLFCHAHLSHHTWCAHSQTPNSSWHLLSFLLSVCHDG